MAHEVFSDFDVDQIGIKFTDDSAYQNANCVGSVEEEMESRTITKKCRGVVFKETTKGTGRGTLKIAWHVPYDIYTKFFDMDRDDLLDGVKGYGKNSVHKAFSMTMHVTDEDGVVKLKAYPNCVVASTGPARKIENGAEEVAQFETDITVLPDANGYGLYEALANAVDESIAEQWMTAFEPDLVQIANA